MTTLDARSCARRCALTGLVCGALGFLVGGLIISSRVPPSPDVGRSAVVQRPAALPRARSPVVEDSSIGADLTPSVAAEPFVPQDRVAPASLQVRLARLETLDAELRTTGLRQLAKAVRTDVALRGELLNLMRDSIDPVTLGAAAELCRYQALVPLTPEDVAALRDLAIAGDVPLRREAASWGWSTGVVGLELPALRTAVLDLLHDSRTPEVLGPVAALSFERSLDRDPDVRNALIERVQAASPAQVGIHVLVQCALSMSRSAGLAWLMERWRSTDAALDREAIANAYATILASGGTGVRYRGGESGAASPVPDGLTELYRTAPDMTRRRLIRASVVAWGRTPESMSAVLGELISVEPDARLLDALRELREKADGGGTLDSVRAESALTEVR